MEGVLMENRYDEYVMKIIRQRYEINENDTSRDKEINELSPSSVLEEVLIWEGIIGYGAKIKGWIKDIFEVDLDVISDDIMVRDFFKHPGGSHENHITTS